MAEKIRQEVILNVYEPSEVDSETSNLIQKAKEATNRAYAPYSNFHVGAALLLSNGEIITGNNQENAAYPAGLCAERVAFFSSKSNNPEATIRKVAIVARNGADDHFKLATPCGNCRQVMSEYENNQEEPIQVYLCGEDGKVYESESVENLLPFKFSDKYLNE